MLLKNDKRRWLSLTNASKESQKLSSFTHLSIESLNIDSFYPHWTIYVCGNDALNSVKYFIISSTKSLVTILHVGCLLIFSAYPHCLLSEIQADWYKFLAISHTTLANLPKLYKGDLSFEKSLLIIFINLLQIALALLSPVIFSREFLFTILMYRGGHGVRLCWALRYWAEPTHLQMLRVHYFASNTGKLTLAFSCYAAVSDPSHTFTNPITRNLRKIL